MTDRTRRARARRRWDLTAIGLLLALVFLLPFVVMVLGSLKSQAEILRIPPTYLPQSWHPDNYLRMWRTPETPLPFNLVSTLVMTVGGTVLALAVAIPAAYYSARQRFPGRAAYLATVLVTQMLQPTVLATGLLREFFALGINDTWLAMILVNSLLLLGIVVVVVLKSPNGSIRFVM